MPMPAIAISWRFIFIDTMLHYITPDAYADSRFSHADDYAIFTAGQFDFATA
jgi:hypothetical protein